MPRIEQHAHGDVALHADVGPVYEANLVMIGDGGDWALFRVENFDRDLGSIRQQGAAKTPGAKRADRCEREQRRS